MRFRFLGRLVGGISLLVLAALAPTTASAQESCMTPDGTAQAGLPPLVGPYDVPLSGATMTVRYHVHLLRNTNGSGGIPAARVQAMIDQMEAYFATASIDLVEVGGRTFIDNTNLNGVPTGALVTAPYGVNPYSGAVNVYLGEGGAGAGATAGSTVSITGLAITIPGAALAVGYRNTSDYPTVNLSTGVAQMRVLTHEMGHALGLFHTHEGTSETPPPQPFCRESANPTGSTANGNTCGDFVLDTRGDPWGSSTASCAYVPPTSPARANDPNGIPYAPLTNNLMSYYGYGCTTVFTPGQTSRMIAATLLQNSVVVEAATLPAAFAVRAGYTTSLTGATIRLGSGAALTVTGQLDAASTRFTASNASQGWAGVQFNAGSAGAWTNTIVERVAGVNVGEAETPVHAISVTDASPTFTGVTVQLPVAGTVPVNGFYVRETAAPHNAVVITNPLIEGMTGSGVVASGANVRVEVVRGSITGSSETAVVGSGSSANVYLVPASNGTNTQGPQITGNPGGGVFASSSGAVRFGAPSPGAGLATVSGNIPGRGLTASGGGLIYAGTTSVYQRNRIFGNAPANTATGNGLATGTGSAVYARCNWWNTEVAPFRTGTASGGVVNVGAPLAADPYTNPSATCGGGGTGGRPGAGSFGEAGRDGETVSDRLLFAIDAATPAEAVDLLAAPVESEPTSAEAAAAINESGVIASRVGAPASAVTLLTATTLSPHAPLRVAAWQALVGSRRATGDLAGALAAAGALASEGGAAAVQAELARVYLYTAAGDSTAALAALGALEALAPGGVEAGLARSFLDGGREAPVGGRGVAATEARESAAAAMLDVTAPDAAALAVSPNPAGTSAAVTLTLAEAGEVAIVVYDVLGRAVQTPLSGALTAGAHRASVDVASLAPGVYVVRASVNTEGGTVVRSARLTVAR